MGKDCISMGYLKLNGKRYNLVGEQMVCDGQRLALYFSGKETNVSDIKETMPNNEVFTVYDCVRSIAELEDGETTDSENYPRYIETDEFIATTFEGFTRIVSINYDMELDIYEVIFVSPIDIDTRMSDLESAMNFLLMGGE